MMPVDVDQVCRELQPSVPVGRLTKLEDLIVLANAGHFAHVISSAVCFDLDVTEVEDGREDLVDTLNLRPLEADYTEAPLDL